MRIDIDMRKAFDTVDHLILLEKLSSHNLKENFKSWLHYYLEGAKQQTRANEIPSNIESVESNVPQSSV